MVPLCNPPTQIISTTPLSASEAASHLSTFLSALPTTATPQTNDLVLSNLRRIHQALQGIHVPRPLSQEEALARLEAQESQSQPPTRGEAVNAEDVVAEDDGEYGEGGRLDNRPRSEIQWVPEVEVKGDKKKDKKARRKAEKKMREDKRRKEKAETAEDDE
ncbi:hypothetical protein RUND412_006668 [Rhizina undulata]